MTNSQAPTSPPPTSHPDGAPGYYRYPTVADRRVVFVADDDLWAVDIDGGTAARLTAGWGSAIRPLLSPDGRHLAFTGREEGDSEIYCMPAHGGPVRRLTYLGANSTPVAWDPHGRIVFASNAKQPFRSLTVLFAVSPEGGQPEPLPYGPASAIAFGPRGGVVLGRNTGDLAYWKRYRGGRTGVLWIDDGSGHFRRYQPGQGNVACPMWIGDRIYFLSDHEGVANLYSIRPDGSDLTRHTDHTTYYARNAQTDGRHIVYHCGGDLWVYRPGADKAQPIPIRFPGQRTQKQPKAVEAARFWTEYQPHPEGDRLLVITRGQLFSLANWQGPVRQLGGEGKGVRCRLARWLPDGKRVAVIRDQGGEEHLDLLDLESDRWRTLDPPDIGRAIDLEVAPDGRRLALSNHRMEIWVFDLESGQGRVVERGQAGPARGMAWSPDSRWLAYSLPETPKRVPIKILDVESGVANVVTRPVLADFAPVFDPDGRYLFFLSARVFDPVYDTLRFHLGFPRGIRPCLLPLAKTTPSPFLVDGEWPAQAKAAGGPGGDSGDKAEAPKPTVIDFEGIAERVVALPLPEDRYRQLAAVPGKILYTTTPVEGSLGESFFSHEPEPKAVLWTYDLKEQKPQEMARGVSGFELAADRQTVAVRSGRRLAVVKVGTKIDDFGKPPGRDSGIVNLGRIHVRVDPPAEWEQMLREAWRLMRDNFWAPDMSGVDWSAVYERYRALLPRVGTRGEFSDLVWEMQGELGTSHAYEMGGDYREEPAQRLGFLGAEGHFDSQRGGFVIDRIVHGEPGQDGEDSPLNAPGTDIRVGDAIVAVDGQAVPPGLPPESLLLGKAGQPVALTLDREGRRWQAVVRPLEAEMPLRYRAWVNANRRRVHAASDGRLGYVHIPDMGPRGYAEFFRGYLAECEREGLIVDVRYNGGGHVSQLILETLGRRRLGYDVPRHGMPEPYPADSIAGPIVAITTEHAGSDGDIFSHAFKMLKIGPLIGQRTWGGVIGIWVRHALVDHGVTTQPEFAFWFYDVGWGVENYGTDPDIPVDNSPTDYRQGRDVQLERAIAEAMDRLQARPVPRPDFSQRPSKVPPPLPPRS